MPDWLPDNSLILLFANLWIVGFGVHYWWLRRMKLPRAPWIAWLLAAALLAYSGYQAKRAGNRERGHIQNLAEDFARLYGSEMEEAGHWKLPNDAPANDPLYLSLIEKEKNWEKLDPDVCDIYTIRKLPNGTNIFIVDSETDYNRNGKYDEEREQRTPIGEVFDNFDAGLEAALKGEANFDFIPITDRWGTWLSAYVPMHDPSGRLDGVLGVDFDVNQFQKAITDAQLQVLWMASVLLAMLLGASTLNATLRAQIAERKRTEESLRLLGSAVEQSKESIVITDAQLNLPGPKIVFVNPAFTAMTGYTAEEILGKTPRILQGPRTDMAVQQRLRETLARGEAFHGENINYRKNKTEFYTEWHIAPIRSSKGITTHFVAIQRDISERKRLEQQLIQSQKLETVGRLAGGIAHDFNNIMTAIIGHADLMLHDLPKGNPLSMNVSVIRKAAYRATALTRQLLAYGRRQFLRPEILNLNQVITLMDDMIRHLAGTKMDVRIVPAQDLCTVFADAGQIEDVITNIILNAQDAMPQGGKLTIETANVLFDEEIAARYPELKPGNYAMLAITDTGKGMTPDVKSRVFEPFFSTKDTNQGIGLGLATSYGIIKQSGGHITAYSEPNQGTTMRIYLPRISGETQAPAPLINSSVPPRGTETILVVEDDPTLLEMAATVLTRLGYRVLTAINGVEALKLLETPGRQPVDLLFTDIVMPKMDGIKLSERILATYPTIKILFASAYAEQALKHQGLVIPGMTLLEKPFTLSALANKIRQSIDAK